MQATRTRHSLDSLVCTLRGLSRAFLASRLAQQHQHFWQRLSRPLETANHGRISVLAPYLTFRSCRPSEASRGQRRPELSSRPPQGPTHLESCPGLAATSLRTWLIHLGPVCLAASPRSWIPADLFFIRAIPHHCLLLPGPGFINLIVLLFRFLGFFYRHPSLRSTRPSFLVLIPITSSRSIRSPPLIPFGVLQHYTNLPSQLL